MCNKGINERDDIAGVVLAGGCNTRFPIQKGFIKVDGASIIDRDIAILRSIFRKVMISTNMPEAFFRLGIPLIGDVLPSRGPMSGIYTALINSGGSSVFVAACDMPFINSSIISLLCDKHIGHDKDCYEATVPVFNGKPQPLLAIYDYTVLPALEREILTGRTALRPFLNEIRTCYIDDNDVRAVDPEGRSFININTVDDFETVRDSQGSALDYGMQSRQFDIREGAC